MTSTAASATENASTGSARRRDLMLHNDPAEIARLAEAVEAFGDECGLSAGDVYKINLALDELLTNLISYAYPDGQRHTIALQLALADGRLSAELCDDAAPFDPLTQAKPAVLEGSLDERPIGGLGLHFVRTLMDEVNYRRDGAYNRVTLIKYVAAPAA